MVLIYREKKGDPLAARLFLYLKISSNLQSNVIYYLVD